MDLVRKRTREQVTDDIMLYKKIKIRTDIDLDNFRMQTKEIQFKDMVNEIIRKHLNIIKPKVKINKIAQALNRYVETFKISIINKLDPLVQLKRTRNPLEKHIIKILESKKGLKFNETLEVTFRKIINYNFKFKSYEFKYRTAFFTSKAKEITNDFMVPEALKLSKDHILNSISQWISEGSGWTIESVDNHYLNIVQYQPMKGSSYIELPQELRNSLKGLINIKNNDNECFRWCHIRLLKPQDKDPQRIKRCDKEYINKLDYSGIEFPVTVKQYNKIENQNEININVFGYENKQPYPIFVSKEKYEKHMELLLITENENKHYVLIKDFNRFMYNQTKHKEKKTSACIAFSVSALKVS